MNRLKKFRSENIEKLDFDYSAQANKLIINCNLCNNEKLVIITHRDRYGYPVKATACPNCGLVFLNPVMTNEAYSDFYDHTYRPLVSAYHGRLINAETIQDEQRVYAADLAEFIEPFFTKTKYRTMIDIGGSTGVVSRYLAEKFDLKATVLDPSASDLEWSSKFGIEVIDGFLEDYEPEGRYFDCVIVCQTVDHLLEMSRSMAKIRSVLRDDGLLFLDIVDFRMAYLRNQCIEEAIKLDHPYYFTQETITSYFKKTGFRVLRINFPEDHLHVGYLCTTCEPVSDYLPPIEWVNRFFGEIRFIQNYNKVKL